MKRIGVRVWQEEFFWPVSDTAYFSLLDAIWGPMNELFQGLAEGFQDVLLADIGFLNFLAQYLHASTAQVFCEKNSCLLQSGGLSDAFHKPDWEKLSTAYAWQQSAGTFLRFQARRMGKNIRFNVHLPFPEALQGFFRKSGWWGLGSFSQLKAEYVTALRVYCDHHYVQTLLPMKISIEKTGENEDLIEAMTSYMARIEAYCREELGVRVPSEAAVACWVKRLKGLLGVYRSVGRKKELPRALLLTENAAPLHKTIALSMRRRGCRIIGFNHGNEMGNFWDPVVSYNEYSHCDEYVCATSKSAESRATQYSRWKIRGFEGTRFVSVNTSFYQRLVEKGRREPFPRKVKSVMIMGYPMNARRYPYSSGDFFLFQLDLELRVARLLKREGYEVLYKLHPDRKKEVEGIFDGIVDRILVEPFESVYSRADSYFFGCITTSTFGFALCLNKPICVIDLKSKMWNPEAYELLSRRCIMLPACFDETNRIQFSEKHLLDGLVNLPEKPDLSYVESFMFASS